jgi:hypothetical protein
MIDGLAGLLDEPLLPMELLMRLRCLGMNLLPEDRDAAYLEVEPKDAGVEQAMCNDIALLAGSHLIASSSWTQYVQVRSGVLSKSVCGQMSCLICCVGREHEVEKVAGR